MGHPYGASASYAPPPPSARRRRRWPWVLLVIVLVLAGLVVVADRVALSLAENKAASTMQTSQHLQQKPDVTVGGFPFLTQVAASEFDNVTISAAGVQVGDGSTLRIATLSVHLHHVTVSSDYSSVRASTATADARIGYADLSDTLGFTVRNGDNGRLIAEPTVTIAGQKFSGVVSAVVHASSDKGISFTDAAVSTAGVSLPDSATRVLAAVFTKGISLAGLPFGVQVAGVDATASGLVLHLTGHDVVYSRSS